MINTETLRQRCRRGGGQSRQTLAFPGHTTAPGAMIGLVLRSPPLADLMSQRPRSLVVTDHALDLKLD